MTVDDLTPEILEQMRRDGYSYGEIARQFSATLCQIQYRAQKWLPGPFHRVSRYRQALLAAFEVGGIDRPPREIAQEVGCSLDTVYRYRQLWRSGWRGPGRGGLGAPSGPRCGRCQFYGWENNPVRGNDGNALCLWCNLELAGCDLRLMAERFGWKLLVGLYVGAEEEVG